MSVAAFSVTRKLTNSEFDQLFREHYQLVYRTAFSVTRNVEDAEEVLQNVFPGLVQREFPPDLKKNPKAYLYRAAFNRSLDIVRSRRRYDVTVDADRIEKAASDDWEFAEEAERNLYEAIANLHPTAAQILMLRYLHNRSVQDIATLLGTTSSTVAVSLFRSRFRLRKLIRALGERSRSKPWESFSIAISILQTRKSRRQANAYYGASRKDRPSRLNVPHFR